MKEFDSQIKTYLNKELKDVALSPSNKEQLHLNLTNYYQIKKKGPLTAFSRRFRIFLENTYEISLTPVAATILVIILAVNVSLFGISHPPTPGYKKDTSTYYVQQITSSGDSLQIIYVPVEKEEM